MRRIVAVQSLSRPAIFFWQGLERFFPTTKYVSLITSLRRAVGNSGQRMAPLRALSEE